MKIYFHFRLNKYKKIVKYSILFVSDKMDFFFEKI